MSPQLSAAPAVLPASRLFFWSVRCELWENRSIYIAPLAVADVYLFGYLISLICKPHSTWHAMSDGMPAAAAVAMPYTHAAWLIALTALIVGVLYCLDALYGERRDRSVLFWKSLPVSDLTAVLSKASIPLLVLPLLIFVMSIATQLLMLLMNGGVRLMSGAAAAVPWEQPPLFQMALVLLYSLAVMTLWHAPIYGWLLLVSSWARRATLLWVVIPPLAIAILEFIAFRTSHFALLLRDRAIGFAGGAFDFITPGNGSIDPHLIPLAALTPGGFLSSPGLWIGLAFAAAFLAAAARMRRDRGPI